MQTEADRNQHYLSLYQNGVQAEAALAYLDNYFPYRREQLLADFKVASTEQLPLIRALMLEVDLMEKAMRNAISNGERAIAKSLAK